MIYFVNLTEIQCRTSTNGFDKVTPPNIFFKRFRLHNLSANAHILGIFEQLLVNVSNPKVFLRPSQTSLMEYLEEIGNEF